MILYTNNNVNLMYRILLFLPLVISCTPVGPKAPSQRLASSLSWPEHLPVYDHIVIVVEENKDYEQIIGNDAAPYINDVLKSEGANFTQAYAEEHLSQGNYFWLFSGSNQEVGFLDEIPDASNNENYPFTTLNLGQQLIAKGYSFKGYSEDLPAIGSTVNDTAVYARKHVPWISFANVPNGDTVDTSSNLRFADFPSDFRQLPTVAFVIPNLHHDMHSGKNTQRVANGDAWLKQNLDAYYRWAKNNNSLLILTFDEDSGLAGLIGLTDPGDTANPGRRNRIATIFAGAHIKPGNYTEQRGINHITILRTLEAMYGLQKSGHQQIFAEHYGIGDDFIITDIFTTPR